MVVDKLRFSTFCFEVFVFLVQMFLSLLSEPKSPYDYFREDDVSLAQSSMQFSLYGVLSIESVRI